MKDFALLRRRGWVSHASFCRSQNDSSLFEILEIKTQVGVSEHALEKLKVAFGLLQSAMRPDGSGSKLLLLMYHMLGVAVKREN